MQAAVDVARVTMTTTTTGERAAIMTSITTNTTSNQMTSERRQPSRETRLRTSSFELRLYVAGFLAAMYTISWRAIGGHDPATVPTTASAPSTSQPQHFVWIDRLPATMRPDVTLPDGWQLALEPQHLLVPTERVVHVPTRRVPSVRTRSS
jgi:hypothetical protein